MSLELIIFLVVIFCLCWVAISKSAWSESDSVAMLLFFIIMLLGFLFVPNFKNFFLAILDEISKILWSN